MLIDGLIITTARADEMVAFYRDRLGIPLLEERHGPHRHWGCTLGGVHVAIHPARPGETHGSSPIAVSFGVDDVDAVAGRLRAAGVMLELEPCDRPFGRLAGVRDPDGNLVYLHRWS